MGQARGGSASFQACLQMSALLSLPGGSHCCCPWALVCCPSPVSGPLQSHFLAAQQSLRHLPHPIPCMILHHPQVASFTITTHAHSALNCRSCALKLRASKLSAHLLPPHPFARHLPGRAKAKKKIKIKNLPESCSKLPPLSGAPPGRWLPGEERPKGFLP